jgi:hypothetical protein
MLVVVATAATNHVQIHYYRCCCYYYCNATATAEGTGSTVTAVLQLGAR